MATAKDVMKKIADNEVKFVDLRFTDTKGKEQHVTVPVSAFDEDKFTDGHAFDGSSVAGWKGIQASDMQLMPDPSTAVMDPFREESTLIMSCDVVEPGDGKGYERDPRSLAKRAEAYLKSSGIGDVAYFGPEPEFFIFDSVTWHVDMSGCSVQIDSEEASWSTNKRFEGGNSGHRPAVKGGYFPVPPVDSLQDIRSEMCLILEQMGVPVEVHHHEVAGAGQCEIGTKFAPLVQRADWLQILKYVVHNVAASYGKTATFMPKPVVGDNGSGMHVPPVDLEGRHQPLRRRQVRRPVGLRALLHRRHHQARARAQRHHQSGHQLLPPPGPALRGAGQAGLLGTQPLGVDPHPVRRQARRAAASRRASRIRSPIRTWPSSALMMAGLDGVQNKIHPGDPADKNLYDLPPEEDAKIPTVCSSLDQALECLDRDREFLTRGGVFTNDMIDAYIELKMEEVQRIRMTTHPAEFDMYYSC